MSSGFLERLGGVSGLVLWVEGGIVRGGRREKGGSYTSSRPELGLMCLRIDPTRSAAMVSVLSVFLLGNLGISWDGILGEFNGLCLKEEKERCWGKRKE